MYANVIIKCRLTNHRSATTPSTTAGPAAECSSTIHAIPAICGVWGLCHAPIVPRVRINAQNFSINMA